MIREPFLRASRRFFGGTSGVCMCTCCRGRGYFCVRVACCLLLKPFGLENVFIFLAPWSLLHRLLLLSVVF